MKKELLIFIDIDGTLIDHNQKIRILTKKSIDDAKKNAKLFVATGRSQAEIPENIKQLNFDGYILSGGSHIIFPDGTHHRNTFNSSEVHKIISFFEQNDITYYLETIYGAFPCDNSLNNMKQIWRPGFFPKGFENYLMRNKGKSIPYDEISKISFISNKLPFHKLQTHFKNYILLQETIPEFGPNSGEIIIPHNNKSDAVQTIKRWFNKDIYSIAIGNGTNDIDMFETVDFSIAMGNSPDIVKQAADYITKEVEDDGFSEAFNKFIL